MTDLFSPLLTKKNNRRLFFADTMGGGTPGPKTSYKTAKLVADFLYIPVPFFNTELKFQFNPTQLSTHKTVKYAGSPAPARDFPRTEYKGGLSATYSLNLIFDAFARNAAGEYERHDVRKDCNFLSSLCLKGMGYSTNMIAFPYLAEPPSVRFVWGEVQLFRAYLTDCTITYTSFDTTGAPTHATAACTFTEQSHPMDFLPAQNPTSRTDPRATVRVSEGERIDNIASNFFGDPRMWRSIAEKNDLDDPFDLRPGQLLSMPMDR